MYVLTNRPNTGIAFGEGATKFPTLQSAVGEEETLNTSHSVLQNMDETLNHLEKLEKQVAEKMKNKKKIRRSSSQ
jgi:hypothetical protein